MNGRSHLTFLLLAGGRKLLALLMATLAFIASAVATTVVPMSVEKLTQLSSHVMVARAVKSWSAWNAQRTMIQTYTQFTVDTPLKGATDNTVTVKQPGGSADGYTQHVSGVRSWSAGESAVLFLQPSPDHDGTFVVTGLVQGDFRVRRLASGAIVADNGVASATKQLGDQVDTFNPADKSISSYTGTRMDLDALKQRVRSAARTQLVQ
jgi:hypothetical protein